MYSQSSVPGKSSRTGARPTFSSRRPSGGSGRQQRSPRRGAYIDVNKFINKAEPILIEAPYVPEHQFSDFPFGPKLARNVAARGYTVPTPVQDGAILPILEGRDVIGLANTGTGKTAAFLLPLLERTMAREINRTLIMVPTRELATQIEDEFRSFAKEMNQRMATVVGGASIGRQLAAFDRRPQFIVATPGRLKDLILNYNLKLTDVDALVLDEADRMVDMGFIKDIRFILEQLGNKRQALFFSATITPEVESLIQTMLTNPVTVSVRQGETSKQVDQDIIRVDGREAKYDQLVELLSQPEFNKVLIFGETKWGVQKLSDQLEQAGFKTSAIHGNKSQPQRQRALNDFKANRLQALIATDVAARGLDIPQVSHVINYDVPHTYEDYIHRIGRTGRAGQTGNAITFVPSVG